MLALKTNICYNPPFSPPRPQVQFPQSAHFAHLKKDAREGVLAKTGNVSSVRFRYPQITPETTTMPPNQPSTAQASYLCFPHIAEPQASYQNHLPVDFPPPTR